MNDQPIACNLSALDEAQQHRRADLASQLQSAVREIVATSDGYAFRLATNRNMLVEIAEFVSLERRCCPFLNFQIDLNANDDSIWIRLGGREGVKEFLAAEFNIQQTN